MGFPFDEYERRRVLRRVAIIAGIGVLIGATYFGLAQRDTPEDDEAAPAFEIERTSTTTPPTTPSAVSSSAPRSTSSSSTSTSSTTSRPPTTTEAPVTTRPATTTTTSVASAGPTVPPTNVPSVSQLAPVAAIFDTETITLAGAVPTQEAADRLRALAEANSKTPATVIDLLTIDPAVPIDVGVRVVELDSVRFPEGEAIVGPEHAAELQRMIAFMTALPQVTVTVVGHADDDGGDITNLLLSQQRADAVVQLMVDAGIDRRRLTAVGVGQTDLLTLDDDAAALALNRRTEFVVKNALA